jgi:predicted MFS family arabinose efflux permease
MMRQASLKAYRTRLLLFTIIRTFINTGFRMVYPFMPVFARALGVELQAMALAVTARSALGIVGPLIGSAGDRIGRKSAMLLGIALFMGGMALVISWPAYPGFILALMLGAGGKILFDPAMQAYLGDHIDYHLRGRSIAITEFGWSGAALVGLPIMGWVISRAGWIAPFPILALSALVLLLILWRTLPGEDKARRERVPLVEAAREISRSSTAMAALSVMLLTSVGNEVVTVVFGAWLEGNFALRVAALGAASAVIGLAELSGEGLVAGFADRLGKRRAISLGLCLILLTSVGLPMLSRSLAGALVGIFLFFITYEFTFVCLISMMTELVPSSRATLMAANLSAAAAGRALGASLGPVLFTIGMASNALLSAGLTALSLIIILSRLENKVESETELSPHE